MHDDDDDALCNTQFTNSNSLLKRKTDSDSPLTLNTISFLVNEANENLQIFVIIVVTGHRYCTDFK